MSAGLIWERGGIYILCSVADAYGCKKKRESRTANENYLVKFPEVLALLELKITLELAAKVLARWRFFVVPTIPTPE